MASDGSAIIFGSNNFLSTNVSTNQGCNLSIWGFNGSGQAITSRLNDPIFNPVSSLSTLNVSSLFASTITVSTLNASSISSFYMSTNQSITFNNINPNDNITVNGGAYTYVYWLPYFITVGQTPSSYYTCPQSGYAQISSFSTISYASTLLRESSTGIGYKNMWSCPISGIWNITLYLQINSGSVGVGNSTLNTMIIPSNVGSATTFIRKDDNLVIGPLQNGTIIVGDSFQQSFMKFQLISPMISLNTSITP